MSLSRAAAAASTVYVSIGRPATAGAVAGLHAAATHVCADDVALVSTFSDAALDRTSWTFAGPLPTLGDTVQRFVRAALESAPATLSTAALAERPAAVHPRVGWVDHVSFAPLFETPLAAVGAVAAAVGADIAAQGGVDVFLYGGARADGLALAELRRRLGYFGRRAAAPGSYDAAAPPAARTHAPDFGGGLATRRPALGAVTVGAAAHVLNYNVRLRYAAGDDGGVHCRWLARAVSARGGGLPGVEALACPYMYEEDAGATRSGGAATWEVACNLTDAQRVPPAAVLGRVHALLAVGAPAAQDLPPQRLPVHAPAQAPRLTSPPRVVFEYAIGLTRALMEAELEHRAGLV